MSIFLWILFIILGIALIGIIVLFIKGLIEGEPIGESFKSAIVDVGCLGMGKPM